MSDNDSEEIIENKIGYTNEEELRSEFKKYLKNPVNRENAINYFYNSLVDEVIFGIIIEIHRSYKCNALAIDEEPPGIDYSIILRRETNNKKAIDIKFPCPNNCNRIVTALKFAVHLQQCMGTGGRNSSRIANRRITSREGSDSYFNSNVSDDEEDYAGEKRKKKSMQSAKSNRSRKYDKSS